MGKAVYMVPVVGLDMKMGLAMEDITVEKVVVVVDMVAMVNAGLPLALVLGYGNGGSPRELIRASLIRVIQKAQVKI